MERDRQVPFFWVTCDLWIKRCRWNTFLDVTLLPGVKTFYKDTFAFPPLTVRLLRQTPGNWNSPRKKRKDWSLIASEGGTCLPGREFPESDNLSDHCLGEPGAETMKGKRWAEPPLVQDCLVLLMHTSFPLFKPRLHVRTPKMGFGLESATGSFCPSSYHGQIK